MVIEFESSKAVNILNGPFCKCPWSCRYVFVDYKYYMSQVHPCQVKYVHYFANNVAHRLAQQCLRRPNPFTSSFGGHY